MPSLSSAIPFIDFEGFGDGTSARAAQIGDAFYSACRDVGFAYLVNHGVPQDMIDEMFRYSAAFFALPQEAKMSAPHPPEGDHHRGYSGVGVEQVSQMIFDEEKLDELRGKGADFKESFDMGNEASKRCPNIWFEESLLPGFRSHSLAFMECCRRMQMMALKALAIGMPGVPNDFFESYHTDADNQLRLLHYPSAPYELFESGDKGRIGAHTDFSTCTFLFQDMVGGLEVESPFSPGTFSPAPPVAGAVVFNIGDFLMRWSNDELKSTLHRVRAPLRPSPEEIMSPERFSIPYVSLCNCSTTSNKFCGANQDLIIDAIPGTWSSERPKKYCPITSGEYVNMRLNATYAAGVSKLKGNVVY